MTTLQNLTEDLHWMGEMTAPFTTVHLQSQSLTDLTLDRVLQLTDRQMTTPITAEDLDPFFAAAIQEQAEDSPAEKEIAAQYRSLLTVLKQQLVNLKVYRLGQGTIDIYILGQAEPGHFVGLTTQVLET